MECFYELNTYISQLVKAYSQVVLNRSNWHTFTQSQAKLKLSFPQYPFLTVFFNQKRVLRNENLSLIIFYIFMQS